MELFLGINCLTVDSLEKQSLRQVLAHKSLILGEKKSQGLEVKDREEWN